MAVCEMCGKDGIVTFAIVEGSQLKVCESCSRFGKIIKKPVFSPVISKSAKIEVVENIVSNFAELIRNAREKTGLTQKEFALKISEKESFVQKLENGTMKPSIDMAHKLEHLLKIKLVEIEKEESVSVEKRASGPVTIGDIINLKK